MKRDEFFICQLMPRTASVQGMFPASIFEKVCKSFAMYVSLLFDTLKDANSNAI